MKLHTFFPQKLYPIRVVTAVRDSCPHGYIMSVPPYPSVTRIGYKPSAVDKRPFSL